MSNMIDKVDAASLRDDIPAFRPGDTLDVHVKVIEGSKERIQVFKGVVIRRQGGGIRDFRCRRCVRVRGTSFRRGAAG